MTSPCWESLADALDRVILSGLKDAEAKEQLARAIADRRVAARAVIDMSDPDIPGQCLEGASLTVPDRLVSENLDWSSSRPLAAWETGPGNVGSSIATWKWKARTIKLLEVSTAAVTRIWCSAGERFVRQQTQVSGDVTPPLPDWFTPMEAVAWIVSRDPKTVSYADPESDVRRSYFAEHKVRGGKSAGCNAHPPPGLTLGWLDTFAAVHRDEAFSSSSEAVSALLTALYSGHLTARAMWVATKERRNMCNDEWHGVTFDSPRGNEQVLLRYQLNLATMAKQFDTRWSDVMLPKVGVLSLWPGRECAIIAVGQQTRVPATTSTQSTNPFDPNSSSILPVSKRRNRGGRPRTWDWDAFDREMMRLANTPDGLPERAELQSHMLQWCEDTWGKSPADSTVRERIARLYPE